jgi:hypothetical protein
MSQPPAPDPFGNDLLHLLTAALAIALSPYEVQVISGLCLWRDRSQIEVPASLIVRAREQAAEQAIAGTLWE